MSDTDLNLSRRAVACRHWRWMPGMLTLEEIVPPAITLGWDPARVLYAEEGYATHVCTVLGRVRDIHDTALPDLDDPATVGCLLALVREAWDQPCVYLAPADSDTPGWLVMMGWLPETATMCFDGHTEAAALVAALEAAP